MRHKYLLLAILLAVTSAFSVSCSIDDFGQMKLKNDLDQNRQLWSAQKTENYRYRLQVSCFCPPDTTQPVIIEVQNGKTVSIVNAESGAPVQAEFFSNLNTIDKLFDVVQGGINRKAGELTVSYDPLLGYPTRIYIDFVKQAVDDEIAYDLTDFAVIK